MLDAFHENNAYNYNCWNVLFRCMCSVATCIIWLRLYLTYIYGLVDELSIFLLDMWLKYMQWTRERDRAGNECTKSRAVLVLFILFARYPPLMLDIIHLFFWLLLCRSFFAFHYKCYLFLLLINFLLIELSHMLHLKRLIRAWRPIKLMYLF